MELLEPTNEDTWHRLRQVTCTYPKKKFPLFTLFSGFTGRELTHVSCNCILDRSRLTFRPVLIFSRSFFLDFCFLVFTFHSSRAVTIS